MEIFIDSREESRKFTAKNQDEITEIMNESGFRVTIFSIPIPESHDPDIVFRFQSKDQYFRILNLKLETL